MVRHSVKPGITGWAQIQGFRGEIKELSQLEDRVHADIWYVENWSFWLDIRIIYRTILNMLLHKEENAY
jgi:putative colanic acid biosynthesis UDP-glucose lipid carrier transferase